MQTTLKHITSTAPIYYNKSQKQIVTLVFITICTWYYEHVHSAVESAVNANKKLYILKQQQRPTTTTGQ